MNQKRTLYAVLLVVLCLSTWAVAHDRDDDRDDDHHHHANPALVAARQKFFGIENVDARTGRVNDDKVILSWITNASFAASVKGRVILLDTYVQRAETVAGRTPFVVEDLVALHPRAIFLGHGHFDHADNAAFIAGSLGIPIYASEETCAAMETDAANLFAANKIPASTVDCRVTTTLGSTPGTEVVTIKELEPVACITAFRHLHSTNVPQDTDFPITPVNNIADPRDATMYPPGTAHSYPSSGSGGPGGPISILYQFRLRGENHFTFVWHNTSGAIKDGCGLDKCWGVAVGQHLTQLMQGLPPTDVELGSIVSLGYRVNGTRDPILYNEAINPKVFIPIHQTNVALPTSSLEFKIAYLAQEDNMSLPTNTSGIDVLTSRPEPRWIVDPNDFLRPLVYDPSDARWSKRGLPRGTTGTCQ